MILERVPSIYFPRRVDNMALRINQIFHKRTTGFLPHDFPRQQARKVVAVLSMFHTRTHTRINIIRNLQVSEFQSFLHGTSS